MFATYSADSNVVTLHSRPTQSVSVPAVSYLFSMPPNDKHESIIFGITPEFAIIELRASHSSSPSLTFHSQRCLPLLGPPKMILPVDPMAWGFGTSWTGHDVLLSVSGAGELAFWIPEECEKSGWRCTGSSCAAVPCD